MNKIAVGVELLFTGMVIVISVLLFLMYLMKAMSRLVGEESVAESGRQMATPPTTELPPEEMVAVMTALGKVFPPNQQAVVRIGSQTAGAGEDETMTVAAIAGALAAVMKSSH